MKNSTSGGGIVRSTRNLRERTARTERKRGRHRRELEEINNDHEDFGKEIFEQGGIWRRSDNLPSPVLMPGLCAQEWRRDLSLAGCELVGGACITRINSTANANPQDVSINSRSITTNPQPNKVVNPNSTQTSPF